jgi:hypothetical protein
MLDDKVTRRVIEEGAVVPSGWVDCMYGCGCITVAGPRDGCQICHGDSKLNSLCSACVPEGCTSWTCGCNFSLWCQSWFYGLTPENDLDK